MSETLAVGNGSEESFETHTDSSTDQSITSHDPGSDYDTDLEMESSDFSRPRSTKNQMVMGIQNYIKKCNKMGVIPVEYFMRHVEDKEFVMKHHGLGPKGAQAIAIPLQKNSCVTKLNLEGNSIAAEGVVYLMGMLVANTAITELNLAENMLGSTGARYVCELLSINTRINKVNLAGNGFTDKDGVYFAEMLERNAALKHLVLSNNNLGEITAKHFERALAANDTLESLDLSWNLFRTNAGISIADAIKENCGLKTLDLSMNGLSLDGSVILGKALAHNRTLRELNISSNRIPIQGAMDLAKGLYVNDTLAVLRVGANPMTAQGALCILTAVANSEESGLTLLDMQDIFVNDEFLELKEKVEAQKGIVILHGHLDNTEVKNVNDVKRHHVKRQLLGRLSQDPMSKLKSYMELRGLRLIDLFRQLDKNQSATLTPDELRTGLKSLVGLTDGEARRIIRQLDKDGKGRIEFSELVSSDKEYRAEKRTVMKEIQQIEQLEEKEKEESDDDKSDPLATANIEELINYFKGVGNRKKKTR